MRRSPRPPRPAQLERFRESPMAPTWGQLPRDARQRTLWLLARLLRSHHRTSRDADSVEEARDE
jgi:hypothetical protein